MKGIAFYAPCTVRLLALFLFSLKQGQEQASVIDEMITLNC
jgi:hypothetical protein